MGKHPPVYNYFLPLPIDRWEWSANDQAVQWRDGTSICPKILVGTLLIHSERKKVLPPFGLFLQIILIHNHKEKDPLQWVRKFDAALAEQHVLESIVQEIKALPVVYQHPAGIVDLCVFLNRFLPPVMDDAELISEAKQLLTTAPIGKLRSLGLNPSSHYAGHAPQEYLLAFALARSQHPTKSGLTLQQWLEAPEEETPRTLQERALAYFTPPTNAWWRWTEEVTVAEDSAGNTLCYRQDLEQLLVALAPHGLPPLHLVLMVLGACKGQFIFLKGVPPSASSHAHLPSWIQMLHLVSQLPEDLRTGMPRTHLLRLLTQGTHIAAEEAVLLVRIFASGELDGSLKDDSRPKLRTSNRTTEEMLDKARQLYPTLEVLEQALRTGLRQPPEALPLELEQQEPRTLLDKLEQDEETRPLARLARQLMAALHIPLHSQGSSDQPLGGVSDLTNRGDYDRLLLSELAHDDDMLMARLANNEALFLRREQPPLNVQHPRILLMDASLRTWGYPRVLAAAAALTCVVQAREGQATETYLLGNETNGPLQLQDPAQVTQMLGILRPAAHCGPGLDAHLKAQASQGALETILILPDDALSLPDFLPHLEAARPHLDYLITVKRDGHVRLFAITQHQRRLLNEAQVQPQSITVKAPERRAPRDTPSPLQLPADANAPAFFHQSLAPLLFPSCAPKSDPNWITGNPTHGVLAWMDPNRLLYWSSSKKGAVGIPRPIPIGKTVLGLTLEGLPACASLQDNWVYVAVPHDDFDWHPLSCPNGSTLLQEAGILVLQHKDGSQYGLAHFRGKLDWDKFQAPPDPSLVVHKRQLKQFINPGYDALPWIQQIGLIGIHTLHLDQYYLNTSQEGRIRFTNLNGGQQLNNASPGRWTTTATGRRRVNDQFHLREFPLPGGGAMVPDGNGLLHLISGDPNLPQVSMVLIKHRPTTAWSSHGHWYGDPYFAPAHAGPLRDTKVFVKDFLEPFIQHIKKHK